MHWNLAEIAKPPAKIDCGQDGRARRQLIRSLAATRQYPARAAHEVPQHVLRVSCRRCERIVEIQRADAVRLYGLKGGRTAALEYTCQQRTGRCEEDGCWPSFETRRRLRMRPQGAEGGARQGAHRYPRLARFRGSAGLPTLSTRRCSERHRRRLPQMPSRRAVRPRRRSRDCLRSGSRRMLQHLLWTVRP